MTRDTLLDFFRDLAAARGDFLVFDDGFRSWHYSYARVAAAAEVFAARLHAAGFAKGDKVVLWGENRPEWIVALWGCVLRGVVAVPIDYRTSADFLNRVRELVEARLVLVGDDVEAPGWPGGVTSWPMRDLLRDELLAATRTSPPPVTISRDDVVQIIFTSGATADPKGVIITHRNVLANIVPIEQEVLKYRRWGRPFFPLRFLNLLPLSHLFGQSMATFIPPMLPGTVVFMRGFNPHEIVRQVHDRRVSVIVCVPKMLDVLREHVLRVTGSAGLTPGLKARGSDSGAESGARLKARGSDSGADNGALLKARGSEGRWYRRWWRHRDVHRLFGWKLWSFVVGAAPLDSSLEEFWSRLGYLVIQGYGLTETAPIVTLNHPFSARKGSVGKPIHGVEVKIADDGEILVRGENVTRGYYRPDGEAAEGFEDGWLHTGDIGGRDEDGRIYVRGRKKEMIVTPEGLNVFPEDVERELLAVSGVGDAAAVGRRFGSEERVHAVLVLAPGVDAEGVVATANQRLADHQRVRSVSTWPGTELPRTEGTRKLKRRDIKAWVDAGEATLPAGRAAGGEQSLEHVLSRFAHGAGELHDATSIDGLGLSSLERVELLMALEERFQVTLDEGAFASVRTVGELRALLSASQGVVAADAGAARGTAGLATPGAADGADTHVGAPRDVVDFPRWNRRWWARAVRRLSYPTWLLPLLRIFAWVRVEGREHLDGLTGPVVFAANHQSHLDAPTILAALPRPWRYRVAIAMAKEFFKAHFFPREAGRRARFTNSVNYYLAALFFNAFPLPQREAGTRQTLRYVGELTDEGFSILIFPEGKRTQHGEIAPFRSGVGMIGGRLGVPVVPVRLEGLDRVLHHTWHMARPGRVRVTFGEPLSLQGGDYAALARQVEEAVKRL